MRHLLLIAIAAVALLVGLATFVQHTGQNEEHPAVQAPEEAGPDVSPEPPPDGATQISEYAAAFDTDEGDSETEVVHGIRVKKDRNCTVKVHYIETSPGITEKMYSCEPNEVVRHPYDDYSDETLAELAYSDAEAARLLGIRKAGNYDEALWLFARSAALGNGNPEPIQYFSVLTQAPLAIDGVPNKQSLQTQLVLQMVATRLGKDDMMVNYWSAVIRSAFPDGEQVIGRAQAEADEIIAYIRHVQINVTGHTTIGE